MRGGVMTGRSGGAPRGCSNPSLQPLRATVPFQLQRGSVLLCREHKAGVCLHGFVPLQWTGDPSRVDPVSRP
ncbi:hypothetical protein ILYODFUR_031116 [Ilyodon furcidens]|uniref:Uncharacterized protein n=1 Tax=Ilyodon furcidens TaxID=33524 RepID=A0ABV0TZ79_9TELE